METSFTEGEPKKDVVQTPTPPTTATAPTTPDKVLAVGDSVVLTGHIVKIDQHWGRIIVELDERVHPDVPFQICVYERMLVKPKE